MRGFAGDAIGSLVKSLNGLELGDKELHWDSAFKNVSGQVAAAMPGLLRGEKKEPDFVITLDCARIAQRSGSRSERS